MADFLRLNYENPKMKQSEIANQLRHSTSILQRYRNVINMLSPYRVHPNNTIKRVKKASNTKFDKNSHRDHDLKRPQMTSNGNKVKTRNNLKGGFVHKNIEINDQFLDEILDNNVI